MLEQIADKMVDGEVAVVCLAFEENEDVLEARLEKFKPTIARFDASAVAAEVEEAQMLEKEMARQARKDLRDEKKEARKEKRADTKARLSAEWQGFKAKFKKED